MEFDLNKLWAEFIKEDAYAVPDDLFEKLGFNLVQGDVVDTWRWGNIIEDVYEKDGEFYGVTYHSTSGDSDIDALGMMATFYRVEKREVSVFKYVRV